jgi:uncharacterized membrane protein
VQNGEEDRLISLTASATYYYRVLGLVLVRPNEHVPLRKCNRARPKPVNRTLSLLAAFFILAGCAIQALTSLLYLAPLLILQGGSS